MTEKIIAVLKIVIAVLELGRALHRIYSMLFS